MEKVIDAVTLMRNSYSCSEAILCAFCEDAGLTHDEAKEIGSEYSAGKKIKCGALCAAEVVLEKKFGAAAADKIAAIDKEFLSKIGSLNCKEIRNKKLRPCINCVEDSAIMLSKLLD